MHLTVKQTELMTIIAKGNGPGDPCDLDQILDRITYETSKQSLQFSIRALVAKGLILKRGLEKRRSRQRVVIAATQLGRDVIGIPETRAPHFVATLEDDLLERELENEMEDLFP